jgi:hypothetical protein
MGTCVTVILDDCTGSELWRVVVGAAGELVTLAGNVNELPTVVRRRG